MNKTDMIKALSARTKLPQAQVKTVVDELFDAEGGVIAQELAAGGSVQLVGFGTFKAPERAEREGRNPQTGAAMTIAGGKVPKFQAGTTLKSIVK